MQAANMLSDNWAVTNKTARVFTKYMNYSVDQAKDEMEICRQMKLIETPEERLDAASASRDIRFKDKAIVNEFAKEGITQEKASLKHLNVMKLPAEEHKLTTEQSFKKELFETGVQQIRATYFGHDIRFNILPSIQHAMQSTTNKAIRGCLKDLHRAEYPAVMPNHVTNFVRENWAWAVTRFPYSGNEQDLENLTDIDSMMIN